MNIVLRQINLARKSKDLRDCVSSDVIKLEKNTARLESKIINPILYELLHLTNAFYAGEGRGKYALPTKPLTSEAMETPNLECGLLLTKLF